jgi:hypothetical protein
MGMLVFGVFVCSEEESSLYTYVIIHHSRFRTELFTFHPVSRGSGAHPIKSDLTLSLKAMQLGHEAHGKLCLFPTLRMFVCVELYLHSHKSQFASFN